MRLSPQQLLAGLYAWGIKGTNDCAAPSSRIVDPAACASAAAAAGKTYDGVVDNDAYPRGCAWCAPTRANVPMRAHAGTPLGYSTGYSRGTHKILVRHSQGTSGALTGDSRRARRYGGGGGYIRLNTALGAGEPNCTLLCALPAPGARFTRCSSGAHAVRTRYSSGRTYSSGTKRCSRE